MSALLRSLQFGGGACRQGRDQEAAAQREGQHHHPQPHRQGAGVGLHHRVRDALRLLERGERSTEGGVASQGATAR